jgi:hypothetical protein
MGTAMLIGQVVRMIEDQLQAIVSLFEEFGVMEE